ncbi:MAG: hypothetical protein AB1511_09175 [Deinococcota bacterium]
MWPEVLRQTLRDARRGWLWWALGLLLYVGLILAFYPSIKSDPSVNEILRKLPASLRVLFGEDLTTPAGYVGGRLFSLRGCLESRFSGNNRVLLSKSGESANHTTNERQ